MAVEQKLFWQEKQADGSVEIGLNETGRKTLTQIKFIDLPEVGQKLALGDTLLTVESDKMVQDVPTPIAGQIKSLHHDLATQPDLLNDVSSKKNWIAVIEP